MKFEVDNWLAGLFGYDVFRVSITDPAELHEAAQAHRLPAHHTNGDRAFYYIKVPTLRTDWMRDLSMLGFRVIDVNVAFARKPALGASSSATGVVVAPIQPAQADAVLDIAGSAFVYSRFHIDPLVSSTLAHCIKREWIANYVRGVRGDELLVASFDGMPAGFLAEFNASHNGQSCKVIDLIGVSKAYQGRGVGRAMVQHFIMRYRDQTALLRVGTQAANIPSMRLYESCGFMIDETTYVLHLHTRSGEAI